MFVNLVEKSVINSMGDNHHLLGKSSNRLIQMIREGETVIGLSSLFPGSDG